MDVHKPTIISQDLPNPAASYPSPRTEANSPPPLSPPYDQTSHPLQTIEIPPQHAMHSKVTDEDLEKLEDDPLQEEDRDSKPKKAPPLPLEHIYVHDDNYPLRLTDFEVMETLGAYAAHDA